MKELAAKLLAEDELSDDEIAAQCGVSPRGLSKWKTVPEFEARRQQNLADFRTRVLSRKYSLKEKRIQVRERLLDDFLQFAAERGKLPAMQSVPGGKTGMVVVQARSVGSGENNKVYMDYLPDTALANEIRAGLKEIAQEVGDWAEKHELGGMTDGEGKATGVPVTFVISQDEANL